VVAVSLVLQAGQVDLLCSQPEWAAVATTGLGDFFGVEALPSACQRRISSAKAATDVSAYSIESQHVAAVLRTASLSPAIADAYRALLLRRLAIVPVLKALAHAELVALEKTMQYMQHAKGHVLYTEGDAGDSMCAAVAFRRAILRGAIISRAAMRRDDRAL
jgi:CRP-like cAMP-binding protein